MHLATFRVSGTGIYEAMTDDAAVAVELWCNDHCDLLHLDGPDARRVLDPVADVVGLRDVHERGEEAVAITDDCLRDHESGLVEDHLRAADCLLLPPLRYEAGAKQLRVLALDPSALSRCYRSMLEAGLSVSVESKREVEAVDERTPMLGPGGDVPELTDRQREVVRAAVEMGYYELPREATTAEVADAVGLARRTAEEHLRRAEKKLVTGLVDRI